MESRNKDAAENSGNGRKGRSMMKIVALLAGCLLLTTAGVMWYMAVADEVTTDDAQVDGRIVPIASKIPGNIVEVLVQDNQPVKAGDLLVRIDARDYQVKVDLAKAALALAENHSLGAGVGIPLTGATVESQIAGARAQLLAARAEAERARNGLERASTSELAFAKANFEAGKAAYERAQSDLKRMKPLVEKNEISRLQYDAYVAAEEVSRNQLHAYEQRLAATGQEAKATRSLMEAAEARVEQARAALQQAEAAKRQVSIRRAESGASLAAVDQARANLRAAELQLSYCNITAPVNGAVTRKSVELGQIVQPGQGMMNLIPLDDLWVMANYKETQLTRVKAGQKVSIYVDLSGKTIRGTVDSIAGATGARMSLLPPENATGNFVKVVQRIPVKIRLEDGNSVENVLRPGMNVVSTIFTD